MDFMCIEKVFEQMQTFYYPNPYSQSIVMGLYIKAGPLYETISNNGISHFLEHIHFRRLGSMAQNQIYDYIDRIGGVLQAATFKDMIQFTLKVRPEFFISGLKILEQILVANRWTNEDINHERNVILREIEEKTSYARLEPVRLAAVWGSHPFTMPILGVAENIVSFDPQTVIHFKSQIFTAHNMYLVITGNINDQQRDECDRRIAQITLPTDSILKPDTIKSTQFNRKPTIIFQNQPWSLLDVAISFDIDISNVVYEESVFLSSIVGSGDNSLLSMALREKSALTYEVYSEIECYEDGCSMLIKFSVTKRELYTAYQIIMSILCQTKNHIDQKLIDTNVVFFTSNTWFLLDDHYDLNFEIGRSLVLKQEPYSIESAIEQYKAITKERLIAIARIIFNIKNMSIAILGSTSRLTKKELRSIANEYLA